MIKEIGIP